MTPDLSLLADTQTAPNLINTRKGLSMLRQHELPLLRSLLFEVERYFTNERERELQMTLVTTNDNAVRLRPSGVDRDGVSVPTTGLTVTIDQPAVASVAPDPASPGDWLVTPLPAADPSVGARTVNVTTTDPASGVSVTTQITFDPGAETSLQVGTTLVPQGAAPAAGAAGAGGAGPA